MKFWAGGPQPEPSLVHLLLLIKKIEVELRYLKMTDITVGIDP
jgi:hypothetical protein